MIVLTGLKVALWPKGDILLARAAEEGGIPFVLSSASNASIEEVAAGPRYWMRLIGLFESSASRWPEVAFSDISGSALLPCLC